MTTSWLGRAWPWVLWELLGAIVLSLIPTALVGTFTEATLRSGLVMAFLLVLLAECFRQFSIQGMLRGLAPVWRDTESERAVQLLSTELSQFSEHVYKLDNGIDARIRTLTEELEYTLSRTINSQLQQQVDKLDNSIDARLHSLTEELEYALSRTINSRLQQQIDKLDNSIDARLRTLTEGIESKMTGSHSEHDQHLVADDATSGVARAGLIRLRPLHDRIVVKPIEVSNSELTEPSYEGEVIAIGRGKRLEGGKLVPLDVSPGDRVVYGKYSGIDLVLDGERYVIMREDEVVSTRSSDTMDLLKRDLLKEAGGHAEEATLRRYFESEARDLRAQLEELKMELDRDQTGQARTRIHDILKMLPLLHSTSVSRR